MGIRFRRGAVRLWSPQSPRNDLLTEGSGAVEPRRAVDRAAALVRVRALLLEGVGRPSAGGVAQAQDRCLSFPPHPRRHLEAARRGRLTLWAVAECCDESCLVCVDRADGKPGEWPGSVQLRLSGRKTTGGVVGGTRRPLPCSTGSTSCETTIG